MTVHTDGLHLPTRSFRGACPSNERERKRSLPGFFGIPHATAKGKSDIQLVLRPVSSTDGEALQNYVRGLSPPSCYNRFLGALNEFPASELARALALNGHDTMTLLATSRLMAWDEIVGEARVALSCVERTGEFGMSIADDWRHLGVGSAVLQAIDRHRILLR